MSLLEAWDGGAAQALAERGPWLVDRLELEPTGRTAADLTVGACDLLLVSLREMLFGPVLDVVSVCPTCGTELEIRIDTDDLWPDRSAAVVPIPEHVVVRVDDCDLECRLPTNRDLLELADIEEDLRLTSLVQRCIVGRLAGGDGPGGLEAGPIVLDALAESEFAAALADQDPGLAPLVELACSCGAAHADEFDIRTFFWSELSAWAERTLTEVHQLASAYGWGEADIMDLPLRRRRAYLDRCSS